MLAMIATLPLAVLMRFVTIAPRWLIYLIRQAIYIVISGLRTLLALMGWGYAGSEDFGNFGFLESLVTVNGDGVQGYPRAGSPRPKPPYYWLVPPSRSQFAPTFKPTPTENMATLVGPNLAGKRPDWMISSTNSMDTTPGFLDMLEIAATPADTLLLGKEMEARKSNGYGNAVDFFNSMLENKRPIPDLDLDGDRGYAFRPWEETPPNERFV